MDGFPKHLNISVGHWYHNRCTYWYHNGFLFFGTILVHFLLPIGTYWYHHFEPVPWPVAQTLRCHRRCLRGRPVRCHRHADRHGANEARRSVGGNSTCLATYIYIYICIYVYLYIGIIIYDHMYIKAQFCGGSFNKQWSAVGFPPFNSIIKHLPVGLSGHISSKGHSKGPQGSLFAPVPPPTIPASLEQWQAGEICRRFRVSKVCQHMGSTSIIDSLDEATGSI